MKYELNSPDRAKAVQAGLQAIPAPSLDAERPQSMLGRCPVAGQTPLITSPELARAAHVRCVYLKDERARMSLGSFKALGAAYVIAHDAAEGRAKGQTYVTASAGNHGLSVAAGANAFGAQAVVFLAETVPESFADRLRNLGAKVERHGAFYEESMEGAAQAAQANGWQLLSDSSWPGYIDRPHRLMEGYLVLMHEAIAQMTEVPTHLFLQAGVGGLAAACAGLARKAWGTATKIIVVEPEAAPALAASIRAGSAQKTQGPASEMGRLDCKEPSLIALKGLARDADIFMTLTEEEGRTGHEACQDAGLPSTPSGAAGIAGLLAVPGMADDFGLTDTSCILAILSEEPVP